MEKLNYYLKPQYDKAKSFYNKTEVVNYGEVKYLYSYNTLVCTLKNDKLELNYNIDEHLLFSRTTLRHIKEFLNQHFKDSERFKTKKEIIKFAMNK